MLKSRRDAAQRVATKLFATEAAIDQALISAAALNAAMPAARVDARLSAVVGQDALDRAAEAYACLMEARRKIVAAHKELDETKTQIGLRTISFGDVLDKPAISKTRGEGEPPLRIVA